MYPPVMLSLVSAPHRGWWPGCCSCSLSPHTRPPPGPSHTQKNQGRGLRIGRVRAVNGPSRSYTVPSQEKALFTLLRIYKEIGTLVLKDHKGRAVFTHFLNVKVLVGAFDKEKDLVGAFSGYCETI